MMSIDDAQPGSPAPATNPYHEMPIDEIQKAESEIDRLHEQHLNGGHRLTVDGNILRVFLRTNKGIEFLNSELSIKVTIRRKLFFH